jgi:hypothetical protein
MGLGIAGLHAVMRRLTHLLARRASGQQAFLLFELGGLGGRMVVVLGAVALVLLFAPVHRAAFVLTVALALLLGLVAEVRAMVRRRSHEDSA